MSEPRVAVAVPLYNEEECFGELRRRACAVPDGLPGGGRAEPGLQISGVLGNNA